MNLSQKHLSGAIIIAALYTMAILVGGSMADVYAESSLVKCGVKPVSYCKPTRSAQPRCAIELTCTDKFVKLGNPDGVCFRPTCPGVWALIHRSTNQNSFRRKFITYRHYTFVGYWQLKDQGVLESSTLPTRELFLVLSDLIGRVIVPPFEIRVGIITALLGSPYFLYLIVRYQRRGFAGSPVFGRGRP